MQMMLYFFLLLKYIRHINMNIFQGNNEIGLNLGLCYVTFYIQPTYKHRVCFPLVGCNIAIVFIALFLIVMVGILIFR